LLMSDTPFGLARPDFKPLSGILQNPRSTLADDITPA